MCVNKHNYFAFILMVTTHTIICWLAMYVFIAVQLAEVQRQREEGFISRGLFMDLLIVTTHFVSKNIFLSVEATVAMYGSILLSWFLYMHLKNISTNRTTNE